MNRMPTNAQGRGTGPGASSKKRLSPARMLKMSLAVLMLVGVCLGVTACGTNGGDGQNGGQKGASSQKEEIKTSPDKYTWYVRDYQGMNLANAGYVSLGGGLLDSYGEENVKLVPVCVDGTYVDTSDEDALKEFSVVGQNVRPNTEIKLTFSKNEKGKEYDNLVSYSSIDDIVLLVKKVGGTETKSFDIPLTEIASCPDAETRYTKDYVGRNLASAGYISLAGDLRDEYGKGNVKLVPVSNDGSFVDTDDVESLSQYYVVSQSVEPNTEIKFSFEKKYENLVKTQSVKQIELKVAKIQS